MFLRKKEFAITFSALLLGGLIYGISYSWQALPIATAYSSKIMCSCAFISGREAKSILDEDLSSFGMVDIQVNYLDSTVTSSIWGLAERTALFREGLGCTLAVGTTVDELKAQQADINKPDQRQAQNYWPTGDNFAGGNFPGDINEDALDRALDKVFQENNPEKPKGTRAVVVLYRGKIVAERYAEGFTKDTPLTGWSMTKSVTNALTGILVQLNLISLDDHALVPEWSELGDPRREITLDHLMRMNTGLEWEEFYGGPSDATKMLFNSYSSSHEAIEKPLEYPLDSVWEYSGGTTNIISEIIREKVGGDLSQYWNFPYHFLFNKIGMRSAVLEPDPAGTFVGSSYMYATARDWARFGLLYLKDGVWNGDRILPQGWVEYSRTPTPQSPNNKYGAHFWLTKGEDGSTVDMPKDAYHLAGYEGQKVVIIPSYELVIVRLGFTQPESNWDFPGFIEDVVLAFPQH